MQWNWWCITLQKKKSQTKRERERIIDHAPRWIWKGFFSLRRSYICMLDLALDEQPFIMIGVIAAPQPYIPRAVGIRGSRGAIVTPHPIFCQIWKQNLRNWSLELPFIWLVSSQPLNHIYPGPSELKGQLGSCNPPKFWQIWKQNLRTWSLELLFINVPSPHICRPSAVSDAYLAVVYIGVHRW